VYPAAFRYHRAATIQDAISALSEFGDEARALAGGQSLIPLMKLRFARPTALVDLNYITGISHIEEKDGAIRFGALARHAEIAESELASSIPIIHDCAAGIADAQIRNRGTIGGSLAEADPSGDWGPALLTLSTEVHSIGLNGSRTVPLAEFFKDAYTSVLEPAELLREVSVKIPPKNSGGACIAFKRCAPVYASASASVQMTMEDRDTCGHIRIYLGCIDLMPVRATAAEKELREKKVTVKSIAAAAEAAMEATQPHSDMRGSGEYKKVLVKSLVRRAIEVAVRRCRGERVKVSHEYVGRS
jgi:aerobic carbon-monoxide dehydrogenase medium subunit